MRATRTTWSRTTASARSELPPARRHPRSSRSSRIPGDRGRASPPGDLRRRGPRRLPEARLRDRQRRPSFEQPAVRGADGSWTTASSTSSRSNAAGLDHPASRDRDRAGRVLRQSAPADRVRLRDGRVSRRTAQAGRDLFATSPVLTACQKADGSRVMTSLETWYFDTPETTGLSRGCHSGMSASRRISANGPGGYRGDQKSSARRLSSDLGRFVARRERSQPGAAAPEPVRGVHAEPSALSGPHTDRRVPDAVRRVLRGRVAASARDDVHRRTEACSTPSRSIRDPRSVPPGWAILWTEAVDQLPRHVDFR